MYCALSEELPKAKFSVKAGSASCADGEMNCRFPKFKVRLGSGGTSRCWYF